MQGGLYHFPHPLLTQAIVRLGRAGVNGTTLWAQMKSVRYNGGVSTLTEMRAQAIALLVLGRSCREAQTELRQQFPGESIPHHSTVARWFNKIAGKEAIAASVYWSNVSQSVTEIILKRFEREAMQMSMIDAVKFGSIATDIYWNSREREQRLAAG